MSKFYRPRISLVLIVLSALPLAALAVDLDKTVAFHIQPQDLSVALIEFSQQARLQVIVSVDLTGQKTQGVTGQRAIKQALSELLGPAGLRYQIASETSITVSKAISTETPTSDAGAANAARSASNAVDAKPVLASGVHSTRAADQSETSGSGNLDEIVVTAQKRAERLQDVPVPVTALSAESLTDSNQLKLSDYYSQIPGLQLTTAQPFGTPSLAIRGVTTGFNQTPTVGTVVDDVPYTSATIWGFGNAVPEIDPSDLQRVEVLRGPQGTLYGASSMGGLLKFVTVDPSTDAIHARVESGISSVHNGATLGSSFRGSVNIPVNDVLALRASAFTREDPGYINDPVHGIDGVNAGRVSGGHVSALWRPFDALSLKVSALFQTSEMHGTDVVQADLGLQDLEQIAPPHSGGFRKTLGVYSANLTAKLGIAELTAISAFITNRNRFFWDFTPYLNGAASFCGCLDATSPTTGVTSDQSVDTKKYTEEVRLALPLGQRINWLVGGFYDHEDTPQMFQFVPVVNFATGAQLGNLANLSYPNGYQEYAVFSDFTFRVTDQFDVQLGGRESHSRATLAQTTSGGLFGGAASQPQGQATGNAFTYLVTPRYRLSEDLMLYARFAAGYRPPGVNEGTAVNPTLPSSYAPDKTKNYEAGVKGDFLNRALSVDASLYYIDWKDLQVNVTDPVSKLTYYVNASRAKSEGAELSVQAHPWIGFTLGVWGAYTDALLIENFPRNSYLVGLDGDRLPFSSRFSGNLSLMQEFRVGRDVTGILGGAVTYVGDRLGDFQPAGSRQTFPSYTKVDFRTGLKFDSWSINGYLNNATDRRGILQSQLNIANPNGYYLIQPRTVGINLAVTW